MQPGYFCTISVCYCQSIDQQNIFGRQRGDMHLSPPSGYAPDSKDCLWIKNYTELQIKFKYDKVGILHRRHVQAQNVDFGLVT